MQRSASRLGRGGVWVVDVAGAGHDEARPGRVRFSGSDQIARAVQVGFPDGVLVVSAKERREVNDRLDALEGLRKGVGILEVPTHGRGLRGEVDIAADQRATIKAGVSEARQEP